LSFFRLSGGADTREIYRFHSVPQRRRVEVAIGSRPGDARIPIRAYEPLRFGEFGAGEFALAFEAIGGREEKNAS
jgi:hypothetical protein